jgi:hypothetical protein
MIELDEPPQLDADFKPNDIVWALKHLEFRLVDHHRFALIAIDKEVRDFLVDAVIARTK